MPNVLPRLDFRATEPVLAALSALGRTEDLRFSPGNQLLALAGFSRKQCLVLKVHVEDTPGGPSISVDDFLEVTSAGIGLVHGLDFIDDQTLVVANRDGRVSVVPLPAGEMAGRQVHVAPLAEVRGRFLGRIKSPGSIGVRHEAEGLISLLVCNNYTNHVSRHVLDPRAGYRVVANSMLLRRSLRIPDGIALSNGGEWIAVSSHGTHDVKMFSTAGGKLRPWSAPAGTLRQANYPHGLRFSSDDACVLVADAGAPVVHVYHRGDGWAGERSPERSVVVLDEEAFARGRYNEQEGGPKGIDIDRTNRVLAVTCEEQTLAFFSLKSLFDPIEARAPGATG
jgi:DNA-binding beta-propeller fold protein YncE